MEEKLRVWLESKRNSKSTHKIFSSCGVLGKTPNPKSKTCQKRSDAAAFNKIRTTNDHVVSRKLFDAPVIPEGSAMEEKQDEAVISPDHNFRVDREVKQPSSSIRNVLSNLNLNSTPVKKNFTFDREVCCDNTPLNKLNALGSTLKVGQFHL